jgi:alkaline phosphatase D
VLLWTRVNPARYRPERRLGFMVAEDERFRRIAAVGYVPGDQLGRDADYTARVDLDGQLEPGSRYFYRFVYDRTASRVGRCRTLPGPTDSPARVRLGVVTCQDFTNGYCGAFAHLAREDVDFVVHLSET